MFQIPIHKGSIQIPIHKGAISSISFVNRKKGGKVEGYEQKCAVFNHDHTQQRANRVYNSWDVLNNMRCSKVMFITVFLR